MFKMRLFLTLLFYYFPILYRKIELSVHKIQLIILLYQSYTSYVICTNKDIIDLSTHNYLSRQKTFDIETKLHVYLKTLMLFNILVNLPS